MNVLAQASTVAESPELAATLSHVAIYVGLAGLIGAAVGGLWVFRSPPRALRLALPIAWTIAALGVIGIAEVRRHGLELDLGPFLASQIGQTVLVRMLALFIAHEGVMLAVLARGRARRAGYALVGAAAIVVAYAHTGSSHAAVGSAWIERPLQTVHVIAMGAWIGGLAVLLLGLPAIPEEERPVAARRFSTVATAGIALVVASGIARALSEIGGFSALIETGYGRMVLFKSHLLIGLAILGAMNRTRHVPRAAMGSLRRVGGGELVVAAVILAVTGVLSGTVPGNEALAIARQGPGQRVSVTTDPISGTSLYQISVDDGREIQIFLDPERRGYNEIHVTYFEGDGTEADIAAFDATLARGERQPDLEIKRFSGGHYIVAARLGAGRWILTFSAEMPGGVLTSELDLRVPGS